MKKITVGVFMGGKGIEREVSFNSGRTVCDHLDTSLYTVVPIFQTTQNTIYILPWRFLHRGKIADFEHRLVAEAQEIRWDDLAKLIDIAYIAMHGRFAEDGSLQAMFELFSIAYTGSKVFGSALGMDKVLQKKILRQHGIITPRGFVLERGHVASVSEQEITIRMGEHGISFPCVVKPAHEGSSFGVSIVSTSDELLFAIEKAATISPHGVQPVVVEEKISGIEFSCIIVTDIPSGELIALEPTEIVTEENAALYDYEQKYMPGRATKYTPARVSLELRRHIQQTCINVMHALEFSNLGRIDGFLRADGSVVIIDPNTLSGMAPSSFLFKQAALRNLNHTDVINHIIETELQGTMTTEEKNIEQQRKADLKKIRVGVLLGGRSNERETSLDSGRNVVYKLMPDVYEPIPLFLNSKLEIYRIDNRLLVSNATHEIEQELSAETKIAWHDLPTHIDFAFIGLHGGEGENGTIQGVLEMLGIPYNGSGIAASALCMDKYKTNQLLASVGLAIAHQTLISRAEWQTQREYVCANILRNNPFPLIVKPHDDGCSVMVQKVETHAELCAAVDDIFAHGKTHALIEECIIGTELTVGVLGNDTVQVLPPSQAVAAGGVLTIEEKFLPGRGENQTPAPLSAEVLAYVQHEVGRAFNAAGCTGYARIDCFYQTAAQSPTGAERVVILEINTLPGLTPATCIFHQAAEIGMKPMEFIDAIIKLGFERHGSVTLPEKQLQKIQLG